MTVGRSVADVNRAALKFEGRGSTAAQKLHAVADRTRNTVSRLFVKAFEAGRLAIDLTTTEILSSTGFEESLDVYLERALAAEVDVLLPDALPSLLLSIAERSGNAVRRLTPVQTINRAAKEKTLKVQVVSAFDRTNPEAVAWAKNHSATLVTAVTEETRKAIKKVITKSFIDGIAPRELSRILVKTVAMTEVQANAVVNLHQRIVTSPGKLVYAGKTAIRVPAVGMDSAKLDKALQSYADRLTRQRAINIARTETISAANEGQTLLWKQAQAKGELPAVVKHMWMAAASERTCQICSSLDGEIVELGKEFSIGVTNPPAHPQCRCTTGLA